MLLILALSLLQKRVMMDVDAAMDEAEDEDLKEENE